MPPNFNIAAYLPAAGWLVGSLVAALLLEYGLVRAAVPPLRHPSRQVFVVVRGVKLFVVALWFVFFHQFWFPRFISLAQPTPSWVFAAELTFLILLLVGMVLTLRLPPADLEMPDA